MIGLSPVTLMPLASGPAPNAASPVTRRVSRGALIGADITGTGWRPIFLINMPVGIVTLLLVRPIMPESRGKPARPDIVDAALSTGTPAALVMPPAKDREHGWPDVLTRFPNVVQHRARSTGNGRRGGIHR